MADASALTADVTLNTDGGAVSLSVLEGLTVTFDGGPLGTVAPPTDTIAGGMTATTFTGVTPGSDFVKATLDNSPGQTAPMIVGPGTIKIEKSTIPAGGTGFDFSQNIDASGNFTLNDGGTATFNIVPIGIYTVTETDPTVTPGGFTLTTLACDDGNSITNLGARTATTHLDPGETVTCVFVNDAVGGGDTTPPRCEVIGVNIDHAAPPENLLVQVEDTGSGVAAINVLIDDNATVNIPAFTPGTNAVIDVVADKNNQGQRARVEIEAIDVDGNKSTCDPFMVDLASESGQRTRETITGVPAVERFVTLYSSDPGFSFALVNVNGTWFTLLGDAGTGKMIDVGAAMVGRGDNNTITLSLWGAAGTVLVSDMPPTQASTAQAGLLWPRWSTLSAWNNSPYVY